MSIVTLEAEEFIVKAAELHAHLSGYLAQAPENAQADVVLKMVGADAVFDIVGANDAKGIIPGQHLLILLPDENKPPLGVRPLRIQ